MPGDERRIGTAEISQTLGYISGKLEGIQETCEDIKTSVSKNASSIATTNARVGKIEKSRAKTKNLLIGAGAPAGALYTYVVLQWHKIEVFLSGAFGGNHGS